jgi:sterol desaturase/sphingolipid hydroxylase (fatty acid hydroxylase superfamily)
MEIYLKSLGLFLFYYFRKSYDALVNEFNGPSALLNPINIFPFIIVALIPFFLYAKKKFNLKSFLSYIFPKSMYTHPSAKMDYKIFFINKLIRPGEIVGFLLTSSLVAKGTYNFLTGVYFPTWNRWEAGPISIITLGIIGFIISDFNTYVRHYIEHKNSFFWRIHSLHHSAEVLTPITSFRLHPASQIYGEVINWFSFGITFGVLGYLGLNSANSNLITQYAIGYKALNFLIGNFQHSHMWIHFGKFFSHIFISPAMHQIHHSSHPKHRNKNMGSYLAIWDWMFGTLYIPHEKEELKYGLNEKNPNPHTTLKDAYITSIFPEKKLTPKKKRQFALGFK